MPDLRQYEPRSGEAPDHDAGADAATAHVQDVWGAVRVCPNGVDGCRCLTYRGSTRDRDAADDFFVGAAQRDGYLCDGGLGLRAWYQANGMIEPEYYRRVVMRRELLVEDAGPLADRRPWRKIP